MSAASRILIWGYAAAAFVASPMLGQGFGGWTSGFESYPLGLGIPETFPPHNTLIHLWSQSGLLAPIIALIFMFQVYNLSKVLIEHGSSSARTVGLMLLSTSLWLFMQGMGENWGLLGEVHQQPQLAALIGVALAVKVRLDRAKEAGLTLSPL